MPSGRVYVAERIVERGRPQNLLPEQLEPDARSSRRRSRAEQLRVDAVGIDLERLIEIVLHVPHDSRALLPRRAIWSPFSG